jgi:hypothetical protein
MCFSFFAIKQNNPIQKWQYYNSFKTILYLVYKGENKFQINDQTTIKNTPGSQLILYITWQPIIRKVLSIK